MIGLTGFAHELASMRTGPLEGEVRTFRQPENPIQVAGDLLDSRAIIDCSAVTRRCHGYERLFGTVKPLLLMVIRVNPTVLRSIPRLANQAGAAKTKAHRENGAELHDAADWHEALGSVFRAECRLMSGTALWQCSDRGRKP